MKKILFEKIDATFASGQTVLNSASLALPAGKVVGMAAYYSDSTAYQDEINDKFIQVGLFDGGVEVVPLSHIESWKKSTSGTYLMGLRPADFQGNRNIRVQATADTALAINIKFQVHFWIETECETA